MDAPAEGDIWDGGAPRCCPPWLAPTSGPPSSPCYPGPHAGGKRYRMEKVVGNGAFGIVWRAREEGGNGQPVAIKKVILDRRYHNRELEMMKGMDHECVIRLLNHFEKPGRKKDETYLHLVMEYCPDTIRSLALQYHKQRTRFPVDHIRVYMYQCLKALEYVHTKRICHRDLKPDNLLTDPSRLKLKLIDFGCAKVLTKGQPNVSYICSRYYRAPELLFGATEYTCAVDLWSVGTILAELLLGHLPFQGQDSTQQHLVEIMKLLGTPTERELRSMRATCTTADLPKLKTYPWERVFPAGTSSRAVDLAHKLLCYDPNQRLTATAALQHPFFEGVEYILDGGGAGARASSAAAEEWPKLLAPLFDNYIRQRTSKTQAELQRLEGSLNALLSSASGGRLNNELLTSVRQEVSGSLRAAQAAEAAAAHELSRSVSRLVKGEGGDDDSTQVTELRRQIRELEQAERSAAQAREAQAREHASMRTQIGELHAKLQRLKAPEGGAMGGHGCGGCVDSSCQTDTSSVSPGFGRRASSGSRLPGDCGSTASPMLARQSTVINADGEVMNARRGPSAPAGGLGHLAADNLGQMTPMGANREGTPASSERDSSGGGSRPRSARLTAGQ